MKAWTVALVLGLVLVGIGGLMLAYPPYSPCVSAGTMGGCGAYPSGFPPPLTYYLAAFAIIGIGVTIAGFVILVVRRSRSLQARVLEPHDTG